MTIYWHGGCYPADGILAPQPTTRAGTTGDGWVYIASDRDLAATYAATLPNSWLMEVEPIGAVEPDPGSILHASWRCRSARVVRRYSLSGRERATRSRFVREAHARFGGLM